VKKLLSLLVLVCVMVFPGVSLVGCGGRSSSQPTGVQESTGDYTENLSEEEQAAEAAGNQ